MNAISFLIIALSLFSHNIKAESSVQLVCPQDVWLPCGAEIWDLSSYGNAYYYHNGHQYIANNPSVVYDLTTCETGKIYRTWSVEDDNWNIISCTQTIYVNGGNFNYTHINWPDNNLELHGCNSSTHPNNLPQEYSRPEFEYISCSMVGSSYKDQVFYFGPDCKKILRKWTVLDWCNYYPGSNSPGIWTYTQTIKVVGTEIPELVCPAPIEVIPNNCEGSYVNLDDLLINGSACYGEYEATNDSPYADEALQNASGNYPIGTTMVKYSVEYGCGQLANCYQEITVQDKAPVPYCLSTLNVALMPVDSDQDGAVDDGMVEVWAKDLNYASYHPCYPNDILKYSFSSDLDSTFRVFTCEHVGDNDLQLWVTDSRGNQSWCAITISVQNNAANIPDCEPIDSNRNLYGVVEDSYSEPLENVYIELKSRAYLTNQTTFDTILQEQVVDSVVTPGGLIIYMYDYVETLVPVNETVLMPGQVVNLQTDQTGKYDSEQISPDRRYIMSAYKIGDNTKIDIEDVEILKSYINGSYEFTNMYSYYAADVNEDGEIDLSDLIVLEDIVEGNEDEWPNERQWVFYDKREVAKLDANENPLNAKLNAYIVLDQNLNRFREQRFLGILKGDLNQYEEYVKSEGIEIRRNQDLQISIFPNPFTDVLNIKNKAGEGFTIEVYDVNGKKIYSKLVEDSDFQLKESINWQQGSYFYRVSGNTETKTGRIVKI